MRIQQSFFKILDDLLKLDATQDVCILQNSREKAKQQLGRRETLWLWNKLYRKTCPRTSWKNTMANGVKTSLFQLWVTLENYREITMYMTMTIWWGNQKACWENTMANAGRIQTPSTLGHVGKLLRYNNIYDYENLMRKSKSFFKKKKCLNGTQNMETSILTRSDSWKRKNENHAEFFHELRFQFHLILSRLTGWYTNWYRLDEQV